MNITLIADYLRCFIIFEVFMLVYLNMLFLIVTVAEFLLFMFSLCLLNKDKG